MLAVEFFDKCFHWSMYYDPVKVSFNLEQIDFEMADEF